MCLVLSCIEYGSERRKAHSTSSAQNRICSARVLYDGFFVTQFSQSRALHLQHVDLDLKFDVKFRSQARSSHSKQLLAVLHLLGMSRKHCGNLGTKRTSKQKMFTTAIEKVLKERNGKRGMETSAAMRGIYKDRDCTNSDIQ